MTDYISGLTIGVKIGNGHFGEVFHGVDPAHGNVAVKVLRREAHHDDARWQLYKGGSLNEAQHLSKATHRNVVQVHHVVEGDGGDSVVICMEYCAGGSLEKKYEAGPMTLRAVKKAATEVLQGLGVLHSRGMLHRDIKPANILLNGQGVAKLADFGLVTDDLLLGYGSQAGYWDHIAHECWHNGPTSAKSDIWALGMTLYRLLHGKVWYEEAPRPQTMIEDGGFVDTLKWLPHIPKPWRTFIRRTMNDDPAKRFQNTTQVLAGIAALPVEPQWEVEVAPQLIKWHRTKGQRRIKVEWERISSRKHQWRAWSEPIASGRSMSLDGSGGVVGQGKAIAGLKAFFGA
ncbi:protein kinase [Erythrobacter sp. 3-20A1M]|uniref:serine/threonine-protein kinase n=1 Tax=Erythrobacter sp. 3-20A1M TaxID=2653850 RepID=UPI001BFC0159|nr:serine/threonine-protein kinase [Erythrobacter sp. 3-20A1M]QWC56735.1 protein kinase [Erythrobacter sp. 3-20A1M]